MNRINIKILTGTALFFLSAFAFSQDFEPDEIEAGIGKEGLPLGQVRPMTFEIARRLVEVAKKAACAPPAGSCSGAFAVVDDAGVLVLLETIDGVLAGGPELATKKAQTAALWRRPTRTFKDAVDDKRNSSYADGTFPNMTTSPGGTPLFRDGRIVGAFANAAVGHSSTQIYEAVLAEATKIFGEQ